MKDYETDPVYMEALEWFVRLKDESAGPQDHTAFEAWLNADSGHKEAYNRARALWDRFGIVTPEYERMRKTGLIGRRGALLGGLAAMALAPAGLYLAARPGIFATYSTDIAERRSFTLEDGSRVELGSYSALSVKYSGAERRVILHSGEGFFDVAPDTARPFIVEAASGASRALGTAFNVKWLDDDVTISVIEHAVSVSLAGKDVTVGEGWQVSYGNDGMKAPKPSDRTLVEAWRQDRIIFEDVPLRNVLSELERYRRGRIVLTDDSIGDIPVTAIFETRHAEAALRTIEQTLPVRVFSAGGFVAFVRRR